LGRPPDPLTPFSGWLPWRQDFTTIYSSRPPTGAPIAGRTHAEPILLTCSVVGVLLSGVGCSPVGSLATVPPPHFPSNGTLATDQCQSAPFLCPCARLSRIITLHSFTASPPYGDPLTLLLFPPFRSPAMVAALNVCVWGTNLCLNRSFLSCKWTLSLVGSRYFNSFPSRFFFLPVACGFGVTVFREALVGSDLRRCLRVPYPANNFSQVFLFPFFAYIFLLVFFTYVPCFFDVITLGLSRQFLRFFYLSPFRPHFPSSAPLWSASSPLWRTRCLERLVPPLLVPLLPFPPFFITGCSHFSYWGKTTSFFLGLCRHPGPRVVSPSLSRALGLPGLRRERMSLTPVPFPMRVFPWLGGGALPTSPFFPPPPLLSTRPSESGSTNYNHDLFRAYRFALGVRV